MWMSAKRCFQTPKSSRVADGPMRAYPPKAGSQDIEGVCREQDVTKKKTRLIQKIEGEFFRTAKSYLGRRGGNAAERRAGVVVGNL